MRGVPERIITRAERRESWGGGRPEGTRRARQGQELFPAAAADFSLAFGRWAAIFGQRAQERPSEALRKGRAAAGPHEGEGQEPLACSKPPAAERAEQLEVLCEEPFP